MGKRRFDKAWHEYVYPDPDFQDDKIIYIFAGYSIIEEKYGYRKAKIVALEKIDKLLSLANPK